MKLNQDDTMVSNQGHLIMLKKQIPDHLHYIISISMGQGKTSSGQTVKYLCSFYPKKITNSNTNDIGVIGGTFIRGSTETTPNNEQVSIIWRNANTFFYGKS